MHIRSYSDGASELIRPDCFSADVHIRQADFAVGGAPIAIAKGDLNNDGILDLVVANSSDDTVSVLLGKSDGTFAPQTTYGTGPEPVSVTVGDFNGDGNLDIAVTNGNCTFGFVLPCYPSTVSILLGNGDGTFRPHVDYAVGVLLPSSVVASDFNGDGKLDLAIAAGGTVSVLLGNGDGTFQTHVDYATARSSNWQSVVVADFNGDHILDLASRRVTRVLDAIMAERGQPLAIRCDNGPELTSRHFLAWGGAADRVGAYSAGEADAERIHREL